MPTCIRFVLAIASTLAFNGCDFGDNQPPADDTPTDGGSETFVVGGTVTGLLGTGLVLQNINGEELAISEDGPFEFATRLISGQMYWVGVSAQPTGPLQTCSVADEHGIVDDADVVSVAVSCGAGAYLIGGTVSGLGSATGLVLQNNAGDDLSIAADGSFAFATPMASGASYDVTVKTPASWPGFCLVSDGSGSVTDDDIVAVSVDCTPRILFVNDDEDLVDEGTWLSALTAAGYAYDYEELAVDGNPVTDLSPYRVVIWSIGNRFLDNLTADNVSTLTSYLDLGGGRGLLYGGGHALWSESNVATFASDYLGVTDYDGDGNMPTLANTSAPGFADGASAPLVGTTYEWDNWSAAAPFGMMLNGFTPSGSTAYPVLTLETTNLTAYSGSLDVIVMNATASFKAMIWGIDLNHISAEQREDLLSKCLSLF